jgi:sulfur relay (sulfurtransferase) DsrF/TusC family protein
MAWTPTEGVLTSGTVTIRVTDDGTPLLSATQTFTITVTPVNDAPTITLTEPSNGARFNEGSDVRITADASDIDGTVARVAFYDNAVLLEEVTAAPFAYHMPATAGAHQFSAKAIDNQGAEAVSAPISISVNRLPTVSLTAPANGASYREGVAIALSATASDNDGPITAVEFYDNGIFLSSDNVAPYEMTYSAAPVGPHTLTARAIDNEGAATVSAASAITVIANLPPVVKLTRPIEGATITQSDNYTLTATATDPDGKITKVEFYQGTTLLATDAASPYSWTWTNPAAGSYVLTAKAYDDNGVATTSAAATVSANAPGEYYFEEAAGTCVMEAENYSQANMRNDTIAFQPGNTSVGFIGAGYMISPDLPIANSAWASSSELAFRVNINTPGTYYLGIRYRALDTGDDAWVGGFNNVQKGSAYYNAGVTTVFRWTRGASLGALAAGIQTIQVRRYEDGMEIDRVMIAADSNALPARNSTEAGPAQSVRWKANINPTVSIAQPVDGATFNSGDAVTLQASASDPDGNVTRVEYYAGATLIGQSTAAPYQVTWNNITGGAYTLTARAIDNRNGSTVSAPITVNVTGNQMPQASITSPTSSMLIKEGFDTTVSAEASDVDGSIAQVQFFDNGASIGVDNTSPFQVRWRPAGIGSHALTAQATDNEGGTALSLPVIVNVAADQAPTVTLTRPLHGATITQSDYYTLTATATDADGKITKVELYQGATLLATDAASPYSWTWSNPAVGTYALTARAYDDNGVATTSATATVSINAPGEYYFDEAAGTCVMEAENFSQANMRNDTIAFQTGTTTPGYVGTGYMIAPDLTIANSAFASSCELAFRVNINTPGTYYLAIRYRALDTGDDAWVGGLNNVQKGSSYYNAGVTTTFKWTRGASLGALAAGIQTVQVRRYETGMEIDRVMIAADSNALPARNSTETGPSESVRWKPNVNPTVSITHPVDGATFNFGDAVTLQASASDPDGNVTRVEYYNGATLIGQSSAAPYEATWSNVTGGAHTLTAKAFDDRNGSTVSAPITINVTGNQMPQVSITMPTAGMVVKEGFDTTVSATASDIDGSIALVEFFDNGASIGVDNASPFQIRWRPAGIGAHALTALATDNQAGTTLSLPVTVSVAVNKAPVVMLTRPLDGASITQSDYFVLTATATDADGKIARVEFYQGATKLGTDAASPYALTWTNPALGTYTLSAKAYDDNGVVTTSAPVTVTVNAAGASYFDEQAGACVMEAEHYSQANLRSDTLSWQLNAASSGYSGEGYMATPDVTQAATNSWAYSSEIAYRVNITTPGTYYIGIRRRAPDGTDDHGYAGVNNTQKGSYAIMGITTTWKWTRGGSLGALAAGTQTIQVRRYDNGLEVDRVMIAADSTMLPARESPDVGPAESVLH